MDYWTAAVREKVRKMTETGGMNGSDNSKRIGRQRKRSGRVSREKLKGQLEIQSMVAGTDFPVYIQLFAHVWNQHR
ncbi:MAG: hypothetical protein ACLUOI_11260 [Eisenbergiella sp.]